MLYFDTSFLVPLVLPEPTSDKVAAFLHGLPAGEFAVSYWTRVEFSSLIAREVRIGGMNVDAGRQTDARFEAMVDESFAVVLANIDDFSRRFETGLRAGDALHLAIAANRRAAQPRQNIAAGRRDSRPGGQRQNIGAVRAARLHPLSACVIREC